MEQALMTVLRREGADAVRRGRPWSTPLDDRALLVAATDAQCVMSSWWCRGESDAGKAAVEDVVAVLESS